MVDSDCLFSRVEREREEKLKQESGREGPPRESWLDRPSHGSTTAVYFYFQLLLQPTFYIQLSTSSS
jgi:hypothetical protein